MRSRASLFSLLQALNAIDQAAARETLRARRRSLRTAAGEAAERLVEQSRARCPFQSSCPKNFGVPELSASPSAPSSQEFAY